MVMLVDVTKTTALTTLKADLKKKGLELGSGVSIEKASTYGKKKKLVAFDLDGTLINIETLDELAKLVGVEKEIGEITKKAMNGEIEFREALTQRVKLLKNLPLTKIEELKKKIPITHGAQDLISELKKAGFITAIITGGFNIFADEIGKKLGVDYVYANKLIIKNGKLTGEFEGEILSPESKLKILRKIASKEGISLEECVAVGDGANDLLIIRNAGLGIGFNPKKIVQKNAKAIINVKDLKVVPALIGIGQIKSDVVKRLKKT
jgi:phosphoserine phosphatase